MNERTTQKTSSGSRSRLPDLRRQVTGIGWPTRVLLLVASLLVVGGAAGTLLSPPSTEPYSLPRVQSPEQTTASSALSGREMGAPTGLPSGLPVGQLAPGSEPRQGSVPEGATDGTTSAGKGAAPTDASPALQPISPAMRGLGLSFIAAFALGVASRVFVRIVLVGLGLATLLLIGLENAGFISVHWDALETEAGGISGWLREQTGSLRTLLTGALPSSAAAATGFFLGFRRR